MLPTCRYAIRDGLHIDYGDDLTVKEVWYDGADFTILDHLHNVYAQIPVALPIGSLLDTLENDYDLFLPLSGLLRADPSKEYGEEAYLLRYLGIHDVDGWDCHHLLFRDDQVDWQLWVEVGDQPLLRKVVVTYKEVEGAPQHVFHLTDWQLDPSLDDARFVADLPTTPCVLTFSRRTEMRREQNRFRVQAGSPTTPPCRGRCCFGLARDRGLRRGTTTGRWRRQS